jgi:hypothetical protein
MHTFTYIYIYDRFNLETTFFSQGPGNFRDVNQNRRNDVMLTPAVGDFNIRMFLSFIQSDGYNPLQVDTYMYIYVYMCICTYICTYIHIYVHLYIYIYTFISQVATTNFRVKDDKVDALIVDLGKTCIYVNMCIYVHLCICIYIYMYIFI